MNMENQDLHLAKLKLITENLSLVIVKNGKIIFETKKQGISGFLEAIEKLDKNLFAALLFVYAGVASVFALTISEGGIRVLEDNNIAYLFEKKVSYILNRSKNGVCPFEKLAMASGSPDEAYVKLKSLARELMRKSSTTNC
jgi:hypothetical protein